MNIYEILVIAAAVVAFVIINIIMWTIIAKIERKEKQKEAFEAVYGTDTGTTADTSPDSNKDDMGFGQPSIFFDYTSEDISIKHKEKHRDFVLNENIVIINTHETI